MYLNLSNDEINKFASMFDMNTLEYNFVLNLSEDSYSHYFLDNIFCIIRTKYDLIYLIYSNYFNSIILYDIADNRKINEIKNAHNFYISSFSYFFDINTKRDLIISISARDNNIKLWNINRLVCLLNIKNINENGFLFSACFLKNNSQNYIISSNYRNKNYFIKAELIKVYDFNGNKIKEIKNSDDDTFLIQNYYEKRVNKNYIITGNNDNVKSYDFIENKIYKVYNDDDNKFYSILVISEEITKLIVSSETGNIRIWNFHSGELLNKIKINDTKIYGICLWNDKFLLAGSDKKSIIIIDINNGIIIKELYGHNNPVITIKKINHPFYEQCIISQGYQKDSIKLWKIRN